jgi:hypothetical protein
MKPIQHARCGLAGLAACLFSAMSVDAAPVRVTVESLSPGRGVYLTPFWVAFHDGTFDAFSDGDPVSAAFQRLAEDGDTEPLSLLFNDVNGETGPNGQDATLTEPSGFPDLPVFDPGTSTTQVFEVDPDSERFFSFASMVIPSNDAFIGNDDPEAYPVFNEDGSVRSFDIIVSGGQVRDAGSEQNTETDAAFLDQTMPDTGTDEGGVAHAHPGYNGSVGNPDGTPVNILGGTNGAGISFDPVAADFTREGALVARIHIGPAVIGGATDGSFSGSWYDPARSGEGLMIEIFPRDGNVEGVVTFYTYAPDGSGQAWIQGEGLLAGDTLTINDAYITSGTAFGDPFDPAAVVREPWGSMTVHFTSCNSAEFSYASTMTEYGRGAHELIRLTPVQIPGTCT